MHNAFKFMMVIEYDTHKSSKSVSNRLKSTNQSKLFYYSKTLCGPKN